MVTLTRKIRFSAAHRYYLSDRSPEENTRLFGPCAYPHGHGHDYVAEVTLAGAIDPSNGMVVNISELKSILSSEVMSILDGEYLTAEHPLMAGRIPATEVIADLIWVRVDAALRARALPATLQQIVVAESRSLWSGCTASPTNPEHRMYTLTRVYEFAAAHRLHSECLDPNANRELFGKCNNPHGHGHNYVLEVTLKGDPDPLTGLLVDLAEMDRIVNAEVVDRYDHRHLNLDIEEFRELNPTSENLVKVIWDRLDPYFSEDSLHRVTIRETERNIFTYERDPR